MFKINAASHFILFPTFLFLFALSLGIVNVAHAATYDVRDCGDLQEVDDLVAYDGNDVINLRNDISCDITLGDDVNFSGTFDGRGYTVTLNGSSLFDTVENATIKNLNIDGDVNGGGSSYIGGLASWVIDSTIDQISISADITNVNPYSGILVGLVESSDISNVLVSGSIVSNNASYTGGVAGFLIDGSTISNALFIGSVDGGLYSGGIIGLMSRDGGPQILQNSISAGSITSSGAFFGAVVGLLDNALVADQSLWLINNYYDAERTGHDACAISTPDIDDVEGVCEAVNVGNDEPDYFYNPDAEPMSNWNFSSFWQSYSDGFPTLQITTPDEQETVRSSPGTVVFGCKDPQASNFNRFSRHDATLCRYDGSVLGAETSINSESSPTLSFLVMKLQIALNKMGSNLEVNGELDENTLNAVRSLTVS